MTDHDDTTPEPEETPLPTSEAEPRPSSSTAGPGSASPAPGPVGAPSTLQRAAALVRAASTRSRRFAVAAFHGLQRAAARAVTHGRAAWRSERSRRWRTHVAAAVAAGRARAVAALPATRRSASFLARAGALLVLVVLGVRYGGRWFTHPVAPGMVAVRQSKWGGGVAARDFQPGLHLSLPGVHDWYDLPAGTQLLEWTSALGGPTTASALEVRTADGNVVMLDVMVPYRVLPGEAHRIVAEGRRATFAGEVRTLVEQALQDQLGLLSLEQFSSSEVRAERIASVLDQLDETLLEAHVAAEDVLVASIDFSPAYEKKLLETQRERQRGRVLEARRIEDLEKRRILDRQLEIDREVQERRIALDRAVEEVLRAGKSEARELTREFARIETERRAEADRRHEELVATGLSALERAGALERQLRAEILSSEGGVDYLTLAAARATRLQEVVLNSNDPRTPNPLDIDAMLTLLRGGD